MHLDVHYQISKYQAKLTNKKMRKKTKQEIEISASPIPRYGYCVIQFSGADIESFCSNTRFSVLC